jgi:hypothetical protein
MILLCKPFRSNGAAPDDDDADDDGSDGEIEDDP